MSTSPSRRIRFSDEDTVVTIPPRASDVMLHSCLQTSTTSASNPVQWDMLTDPQSPRLPALDDSGDDPMMQKHAFPESISEIQINCDKLPWAIVVEIKQDNADRVPQIEAVFKSIYASLQKLASSDDFNEQTTERQRQIEKAYRRRCRQLSGAETHGLRRIDFLEGQTKFFGLSPGNGDDEWLLHVGQKY